MAHRRNARRTSATAQRLLEHYLEQTQWARGIPGFSEGARPSQIKAAAKKIQRSGMLPYRIAKHLGLNQKAGL